MPEQVNPMIIIYHLSMLIPAKMGAITTEAKKTWAISIAIWERALYLCTESLIVNFDTNLVYHLKNLRFAEREGTISPIMKGKEGLVPTQVEIWT